MRINQSNSWRTVVAVCLAILGLIILVTSVIYLIMNQEYFVLGGKLNLNVASEFGEFVGGMVGTLWTLSGILLVLETLRIQRIEFRETTSALEKQQFENTFFGMLNILHEIVNNTIGDTKLFYSDGTYVTYNDLKGREFFSKAFDDFRTRLDKESDN